MSEADLVFFVGTHAGGQITAMWKIPAPGTTVIQLDIDGEQLGRNYVNAVSLQGDAKVGLRAMVNSGTRKSPESAKGWTGRVQQLVAEWRAEADKMRNSDAVPMRPERICKELTDWLPDNGVIVTDTGHAGMWSGQMIDLDKPGQRYIRCEGSLGWGLPGAMGVKCALPDQPVLCFTGDGGLYYHMTELETALRYGINLVVLVNNNRALSQELPSLKRNYDGKLRGNSDELWKFSEFDFAKVAQAMGCGGIRVEKPGEIKGALKEAFSMAANQPVVVEVISDVDEMAPAAWAP